MKKQKTNITEAKILRLKAEEHLKNHQSIVSSISSESDALKLNHELAVHQLELELQNKELIDAKENLEVAVEKYTELYDFAPTGYLTLSREGQIIELNLSGAKILGKERQRLIKNMLGFFVTNDTKPIFNHFLLELFNNQTKQSCEVTLLTEGNLPIYVYLIGHVTKNGNQCDISMIDITQHKLAEEQMKNVLNELTIANKELEQALQINVDKNRFISILAHDLRSPFSVLLGYSELLLEKIPQLSITEIEKFVREIKDTTQGTFTLLEDVLKWASLQSDEIPFKPQKLKIADIYMDIINMLKPASNAKNIKISYSVHEGIEVIADVDMLKAILRNLLSNAIKFTKNNGEVKLTAEQTDTNIMFSVSDTGIGIEPHNLTKLFDLAQFHKSTGTAGEQGTGFGLFLCKGLVEKQGGKIWAESKFGKGSIFYFNIPRIHKSVEKRFDLVFDEENKINNLKILIADDNDAIRLILGEMVRKYSRELLFAKTGNEAVSTFQNNPDIDLILMDVYMPEMNGYEATRIIRQINNEVIIIVETADKFSEVTEEFAGVKINDYLPKPYNKPYLNQLIIKHFNKKNKSK